MPADPELQAIEEIAAAWMVRHDRGLSAVEERDLSRWLMADPRHAAAFDALLATWAMLGEVRPTREQAATSASSRRRVLGWFPLSLAAAAALAIGFFAWRQTTPANPGAPFALTAAAEIGELRRVDLPDGSVIQLNTDSAVEVRYAGAERRVRLQRGEAHFSVAKNPARPFIVSAAGVNVRVLGTVFNVRLRPASVDVLVTEGHVRVGAPGGEKLPAAAPGTAPAALSELRAGQKVSIALGTLASPVPAAAVDVSATEVRQTLAWQSHTLEFDGTPLGEIVAEFNRYNRHQLVLADPGLSHRRFGGTFPASDSEAFVRLLETDFGFLAERRGGETLLKLKAP